MIYRNPIIGMNSCAQAINDEPKTLREQIAKKIEDSNAYSAQNEFFRRIDKLENDTRISVEALIEEVESLKKQLSDINGKAFILNDVSGNHKLTNP